MNLFYASVLSILAACNSDGVSESPLDAPASSDASPEVSTPDAPGYSNRRSLRFDGIDDHVVIPGSASLSQVTDLTIELWVNPTFARAGALLAKNLTGSRPQYALERTSIGTATASVSHFNSGCIAYGGGEGAFAVGTWTHVAATYRTATGAPALYLDGELIDVSTCTTPIGAALNSLVLGAIVESGATRNYFAGLLDEVRVWNVARSQAEIQAARMQVLTGDEPGLVGYWSFEDADEPAHDRSAHANHGRLGATAATDAADPQIAADVPFE